MPPLNSPTIPPPALEATKSTHSHSVSPSRSPFNAFSRSISHGRRLDESLSPSRDRNTSRSGLLGGRFGRGESKDIEMGRYPDKSIGLVEKAEAALGGGRSARHLFDYLHPLIAHFLGHRPTP